MSHPRDRALEMVRNGASLRRVAADLGVSKSTVHRWTQGPVNEDGDPSPPLSEQQWAEQRDRELGQDRHPGDDGGATTDLPPPSEKGVETGTAYRAPESPELPAHRLYLAAVLRYINLTANGVAPHHAERAVRQIDPGFMIEPSLHQKLLEVLSDDGLDPRSIEMSQGYFANINPPAYVLSVYDEFAMGEGDIAELAAVLVRLREEQWALSISQQLVSVGRQGIASISDSGIRASIAEDSRRAAEQIAETYNRDLASTVSRLWIALSGERGRQMSRRWLWEAVRDWADARAAWKSEQIAAFEGNDAFLDALFTFLDRNPGFAVYGRIQPDECVCDYCQYAVDLGRQPLTVLEGLDLPAHLGCDHGIEVEPADEAKQSTAPLWTGHGDGELTSVA